MADSKLGISITAKRRILKFAEGADPKKDKPFEIIEKKETYEGQQALDIMARMGMHKPHKGGK